MSYSESQYPAGGGGGGSLQARQGLSVFDGFVELGEDDQNPTGLGHITGPRRLTINNSGYLVINDENGNNLGYISPNDNILSWGFDGPARMVFDRAGVGFGGPVIQIASENVHFFTQNQIMIQNLPSNPIDGSLAYVLALEPSVVGGHTLRAIQGFTGTIPLGVGSVDVIAGLIVSYTP